MAALALTYLQPNARYCPKSAPWFSPPPENFVWDRYNKDGKPGRWEGTPKQFFAVAKGEYEPKESFSLIHDPRNEFGKLYTVDKLGNIWGGRPVL